MLQVFTDPVYTRNIWIVAPSYMLAFRIFDDSGFSKKLRSVPEDDQGIDIEFLRREIRKSEERAAKDENNAPVSRHAVHRSLRGVFDTLTLTWTLFQRLCGASSL